jgi:PAS domain S-box-containing protein
MVFGIARRRTAAEKSLRASEYQYKRLVELTFESIIILFDERFVFANAQAVKLFDARSETDLIGESIGKYLHPASFAGFRVWAERLIEDEDELPLFEEQFVRSDNTCIDVEAAGLVIPYQGKRALLFVIKDITARKQTEKTLHESNTRFEELLESAPDAIVVSDKNSFITLVNAQAEGIFGYSRQEMMGKSVEMLLPDRSRKLHIQQRNSFMSAPKPQHFDANMDLMGRRKDGSIFPIDVKLSSFFTEQGLRITTIIRDVTERKQAEEQVVRSARLAALGQMSTALAHELNNPLQIIKGYLDIILDFPTEWEEIFEYVQIIRQQINRLHEDAQSILNYAQPIQKPSQLVDVADLVRQVLGLAAKQVQQSGLQVIKEFAEVPMILAAPDSLVQVFLNLVINAVESANKTNCFLQITLKAVNGHVTLSFISDGPGIPNKDLPYIFDPFFTTKPGGNGLGLWISRNLVEQNRGSLSAQNLENGQGIAFILTFPQAVKNVEVVS